MGKQFDFSKFAKDEKSFKTGDVIEFRRGRFAGKIATIGERDGRDFIVTIRSTGEKLYMSKADLIANGAEAA